MKNRLPVELWLPDDVRGQPLGPYTYTWYNKLIKMLKEVCPGSSFAWIDTARYIPDFVYVDEETAMFLILKHNFKGVVRE